VAESVMWKAYN